MLIVLALTAAQPEMVTVDADHLRELCMVFRYNSYLLQDDGRWRDQHGDPTAYLPLEAPFGPCEAVGIDDANQTLDPKGTNTNFPNTDLNVEKRRIKESGWVPLPHQ